MPRSCCSERCSTRCSCRVAQLISRHPPAAHQPTVCAMTNSSKTVTLMTGQLTLPCCGIHKRQSPPYARSSGSTPSEGNRCCRQTALAAEPDSGCMHNSAVDLEGLWQRDCIGHEGGKHLVPEGYPDGCRASCHYINVCLQRQRSDGGKGGGVNIWLAGQGQGLAAAHVCPTLPPIFAGLCCPAR